MKNYKLAQNITGIVLVLLSAVLWVGSFTFLKTCGPKEDGTWMACHWAGQAIIGISCVITILTIVNLFVKDGGIKTGLSIGVIADAVLGILIPGRVIDTCMMADMQCNAVTRPGVSVFGGLIIIAAGINLYLGTKKEK